MKKLLMLLIAGCGGGSELSDLTPTIEVDPGEVIIEASPFRPSSTAPLRIKNVGSFRLSLSAVTMTGDASLSLGGEPPQHLAPGAVWETRVQHLLGTEMRAVGQIAIASDDPKRPLVEVPVNAMVAPAPTLEGLCLAPSPVDFGTVEIGGSVVRTVEARNCGERTIRVDEAFATGAAFSADPRTELPLLLEPNTGTTWRISVRFGPRARGDHEGRLLISGEDGVASISLRGRSNDCILQAERSLEINADLGSETLRRVRVKNIGASECDVREVRVAGSAFSVLEKAPFTLLSGEETFVDLAYRPESLAEARGTLTLHDDEGALLVVELLGIPRNTPCTYRVTPETLDLGGVNSGDFRLGSLTLERTEGTCAFHRAEIAPPFYVDTDLPLLLDEAAPRASLPISFRPETAGDFEATLSLGSNVDTRALTVAGTGLEATLCVDPAHLAFGETSTPKDGEITVTACGVDPVMVNDIAFVSADTEITLQPVTLPVQLSPGGSLTLEVGYRPEDDQADTALLAITDGDGRVHQVRITGGPEVVPPEAGAYLYFWRIDPPALGEAPDVLSDVVRVPLQGAPIVEPMRGPSANGNKCSGCHTLSPDGRFLAVIDAWYTDDHHINTRLSIIDVDDGGEVVPQIQDAVYVSWRPDVETNPPYQFVYSRGGDLHVGSVFGELGAVPGADLPDQIETMPSWSPGGEIVFARQEGQGSPLTLAGPTRLMRIPEAGGTAAELAGTASGPGLRYYPRVSPDGRFIAYTESADVESGSFANPEAKIRIVASDGSEAPTDLLNVTEGASSYPTWSPDGSFLAFGSDRPGGRGSYDLYLVPIDEDGQAGSPNNIEAINSSAFEHAAEWSR